MAAKEIRRSLNEFSSTKKSLINYGLDFTISETNYTKNIKTKQSRVFFSNDKKDFLELKLINLTKRDANLYCDNFDVEKITEQNIDWYKLTEGAKDIFKNSSHNGFLEVYKLDLSGAYWRHAENLGVLSKETLDFFQENKDNFLNGSKQARLKALGSCATRKLVSKYVEGRLVGEPTLVYNEVLRNLYLNICRDIDNVMKSITIKYSKHSIYYYWDCVFLNVTGIDIEEVKKFTLHHGFESKFETSVVKLNRHYESHLKDVNSGVQYPIRKNEL